MNRDDVNTICAEFPGATCEDPWGGGHDAWKIGGKIFASIGAMGEGVSVKTESIDQAQFLIDQGRARKAPYFHRSWVLVPFGSDVEAEEMQDRLTTSYLLVRGTLTRKVQASLPPFDESPSPPSG